MAERAFESCQGAFEAGTLERHAVLAHGLCHRLSGLRGSQVAFLGDAAGCAVSPLKRDVFFCVWPCEPSVIACHTQQVKQARA